MQLNWRCIHRNVALCVTHGNSLKYRLLVVFLLVSVSFMFHNISSLFNFVASTLVAWVFYDKTPMLSFSMQVSTQCNDDA